MGEDRLALVRRFVTALGLEPAIVQATQHAVRRQTVRLQWDALRMIAPAGGSFTERARSMWEAVAPFLGVTNAATAARYTALADAAPGTLGRAYFEFIRSRGLPFPGEQGGAPEGWFVAHDLTHILTGCGTDGNGEVEIIGFQAGNSGSENPLESILLAFVQAQLGIVLDPVAPSAVGGLNFDRLARGFVRGTKATIDFGDGWDYWPDLGRPLDEVRARYGVEPLPA